LRAWTTAAVQFQKMAFELGQVSVRTALKFQRRLFLEGTSEFESYSVPKRDVAMAEEHEKNIEQRVRERAYQIWLEEGQPAGREREHWERAKAQIEQGQHKGEEPPLAGPYENVA
jgi:DUF2934 family protein